MSESVRKAPYDEIDRLRAENARLREALTEIATDPPASGTFGGWEAWALHLRNIALVALNQQEEKNENSG